jgi:hypothetical protein
MTGLAGSAQGKDQPFPFINGRKYETLAKIRKLYSKLLSSSKVSQSEVIIMKAAQIHGPKKISYDTVPDPTIRDGGDII